MFYLIYKITNTLNHKVYVGSHKTKDKDDGYMGSGKYLLRAIKKHGIEKFTKEILFEFENAAEMYAKEAELVNEDFLVEENTYNLKLGGFGGFDYLNTSGKNLYGNNGKTGFGGENLRKSITKDRMIKQGRYDEYLQKISDAIKTGYAAGRIRNGFLNKEHTSETKRLIGEQSSLRETGSGNSQFGTMWITDRVINKKIKKTDTIPRGWTAGRTIRGQQRAADLPCK